MRNANCVIVLLLLATNTAWAQFTESDSPDSTGFVLERLGRIDAVINAEIASGKIPGAVALVARNGKIAYFKSFGFADIESLRCSADTSSPCCFVDVSSLRSFADVSSLRSFADV